VAVRREQQHQRPQEGFLRLQTLAARRVGVSLTIDLCNTTTRRGVLLAAPQEEEYHHKPDELPDLSPLVFLMAHKPRHSRSPSDAVATVRLSVYPVEDTGFT
jgi:hypothetical protein